MERRSNRLKSLFQALVYVPILFMLSVSQGITAGDPELVFYTFISQAEKGSFQLANGTIVNPQDWPTLLVAVIGDRFDASGKPVRATCTATLIGPGLLITAAHCFDAGPHRFSLKAAIKFVGRPALQLRCRVADQYAQAVKTGAWAGPPRVEQDFALCDFAVPANLPHELVNLDYEVIDTHTAFGRGNPVLMTGYGCGELTLDANGGMTPGKYDRHLRIGDAVIAVPAAIPAGNSVAIFSDPTQPALCPGDSGGPLLSGATAAYPSTDPSTHQAVHRRLRGINSTLDSQNTAQGVYRFVSTIAVLSAKAFTDLTSQWMKDNPTGTICGINGNPSVPPCAD